MKKILSLFVLLVAIVTGAKAQSVTILDTKFASTEWQSAPPANTGLSEKNTYTTGSSAESITASFVGKGCKLNDTKNVSSGSYEGYTDWFRFGSSGNYLTITTTAKAYKGGKIRALISAEGTNKVLGTLAVGGQSYDINSTTAPDPVWQEFEIPNTVNDAVVVMTFTRTSTTMFLWGLQVLTNEQATGEAYTVTFDAGTNGTCATETLTEESAGAGITLPNVTGNEGYAFDAWYSAATEGTKLGEAGDTYYPEDNVTIYAQYIAAVAPTINVDATSVSTYTGVAKTFTATADGAPAPTVTWYQNESASTTGGTSVGTGLTYNPDVTAEGTFYYYAVASNGVGTDAVSDLITLTVEAPVTVYDATDKSEDIVVLTKENINTYQYLTVSSDNWNNGKTYGDYTGDFYNMSSTSRTLTIKVKGAENFEAFVNNNTEGRTYTIQVGSGDKQTITHGGSGVESSGVIATGSTDEVTITLAGGGSSVYPVYIKFNVPQTATVTLNSKGFATYSSKYDFTYEGADAYGMALTATSLKGTKVTSGKIKAGEGILFKGAADAIVNITETTGAEALEGNDLIGTTDADNEIITSDAAYKYALSGDTFVTFTGSLKANKAFFGSATQLNSLDLVFDDEIATAINGIEASEAQAAPVKVIKNGKLYIGNYNVAGQQVK